MHNLRYRTLARGQAAAARAWGEGAGRPLSDEPPPAPGGLAILSDHDSEARCLATPGIFACPVRRPWPGLLPSFFVLGHGAGAVQRRPRGRGGGPSRAVL